MTVNRWQKGFTLLELLIVIAIMGIVAIALIPNILSARATAHERAAQAHANNVFTAAFAHLAESYNNTLVTSENCMAGYTAGNYSAPSASGSITSCEVTEANNGLPRVRVVTIGGEEIVYQEE